jgi:hypothetical protein
MDVDAVVSGLRTAISTYGLDGVELEFRVGHTLAGGHFVSTVSKAHWTILCDALARQQPSSPGPPGVRIETIEKIDEVKHVTTVRYGDDPPPPPYCMTKTKVFQIDGDSTGETPYTLRAGIALERIVKYTEVSHPKITRHKRRWRFTRLPWVFDMTEVTSNADLDAEESYEVELELFDPGILYEEPMEKVVRDGVALLTDLVRAIV